MEFAKLYLDSLKEVFHSLPLEDIKRVCDVLHEAYLGEKTVFLFGNGGSAALASHMACDLGKGTFAPCNVPLPDLKRFKALSLTDNVPMLTAWSNDTAYHNCFSDQMANFLQSGDIAFGISGSGNSPNVLKALETARSLGAITVGLCGNRGGKMKPLLDHPIIVASDNMQLIEDAHCVVAHLIFLELRVRISGFKPLPAQPSPKVEALSPTA